MKPRLKRIHSPDFDFSGDYTIGDELFVQLMIGPEDERGEESFDVMVCTPSARDRRLHSADPDAGKYLLVLERIHAETIAERVNEFLAGLEEPTWHDLAIRIGKIGKWEFADYKP